MGRFTVDSARIFPGLIPAITGFRFTPRAGRMAFVARAPAPNRSRGRLNAAPGLASTSGETLRRRRSGAGLQACHAPTVGSSLRMRPEGLKGAEPGRIELHMNWDQRSHEND